MISVEEHAAAVEDLLASDGLTVTASDGYPAGSGWQGAPGQSAFLAFLRVRDISGAAPTGTIDGVRPDRRFLFHVQAIAGSFQAANRLRDRAQGLMLSGGLEIPGRALLEPVQLEQPGQTDPDTDQHGATVWVGWDQYRVWTTPTQEGP